MTDSKNRSALLNTVQHLETDNSALRLKLARHEFREMQRELTSEHPFKLDVYTIAEPAPERVAVPEIRDVWLPHLPVPMGSIHAGNTEADLPVIGVYDDGMSGSTFAAALRGLMNTQYHSPFARLVFLCSGFEAVPFLGRYGFVCEVIANEKPSAALGRLNRRYGATQILSIGTGAVIADLSES